MGAMSRLCKHDDVMKWKHFPRFWLFVRGIHRSLVNSPHKGQWRGALMFSLIYAWINVWANHRDAGDLRRYPTHYDVTVMVNCCSPRDTLGTTAGTCGVVGCSWLSTNKAPSSQLNHIWKYSNEISTYIPQKFVNSLVATFWVDEAL